MDDNLSVATQIQLQKEPSKGILKPQGPGETSVEKERWNAVLKSLTFLGINPEKGSDFVIQTSIFGAQLEKKLRELLQKKDPNSANLIQMIQGKVEEENADIFKDRVQNNLQLIQNLVDSLTKGKKITLPGITPIPWEPCTISKDNKVESPTKDREETEAINNAKRASNSKYKTLPCKWFHSGLGCERGDNCDFIHDYSYKGVMPPPHTYKQKKSQMLQQKSQGAPQVESLYYQQLQQANSLVQQGLSKVDGTRSMQKIGKDGNINNQTDRDLRSEQRLQRPSQNEVYRGRNYSNEDFRNKAYRQNQTEEDEQFQSSRDSKRFQTQQSTEPQEESSDQQNKKSDEPDTPNATPQTAKEETSDQMIEESIQDLKKPSEGKGAEGSDLEEGQVPTESRNSYYKKNFENRDYYNNKYRYMNRRTYDNPYNYSEGYEGEENYDPPAYGNEYYNNRAYYNNGYYYNNRYRHNYRNSHYDNWGQRDRAGGWRNSYRYDDAYEDEYYDEDEQQGNYDDEEEGQRESEQEEGDNNDKDSASKKAQKDGPEDGEEKNAGEEAEGSAEDKNNDSEKSKPEEPQAKEEDKKETPKDKESSDKQSSEGQKNRREDRYSRRGDRGDRDRYNSSGRYGPFGGKARYNRSYNYNNGFFNPQGENLVVPMMYNMPFMNYMNNSFDLNTMMQFANNFQNYAQNQRAQNARQSEDSTEGAVGGSFPEQLSHYKETGQQQSLGEEFGQEMPQSEPQVIPPKPDKIEEEPMPQTDKDEQPAVSLPSSAKPTDAPFSGETMRKGRRNSKYARFQQRFEPTQRTPATMQEEEQEEDEEDAHFDGEEEQKEEDRNENSYQEDQNEEDMYEDQNYYHYNDYRFNRQHRDHDQRSAHFHQQQRMKFFNLQLIETFKKYPPDAFRCTFPHFFSMNSQQPGQPGQPSQPQPQNPNFNNMQQQMYYMMSQFFAASGMNPQVSQPQMANVQPVYPHHQSHPVQDYQPAGLSQSDSTDERYELQANEHSLHPERRDAMVQEAVDQQELNSKYQSSNPSNQSYFARDIGEAQQSFSQQAVQSEQTSPQQHTGEQRIDINAMLNEDNNFVRLSGTDKSLQNSIHQRRGTYNNFDEYYAEQDPAGKQPVEQSFNFEQQQSSQHQADATPAAQTEQQQPAQSDQSAAPKQQATPTRRRKSSEDPQATPTEANSIGIRTRSRMRGQQSSSGKKDGK